MADKTIFRIEITADDLMDDIREYAMDLCDRFDISEDRLMELAEKVCEKAASDCNGDAFFSAWFYNSMPRAYDLMISCIGDATDSFIANMINRELKED